MWRWALIAAAVAALAWWARRGPGVTVPAPRAVTATIAAAPVAERAAPARGAEMVPPSLADTEVDGVLGMDAAGNLILTEEVRRFFDYFLTASGEQAPAVIRARIESALDARLPARAAGQGRDLLGRYLAYREAARELGAEGDLEARRLAVESLRRRHLGAEAAEKLFASELAPPDPQPEERAPADAMRAEASLPRAETQSFRERTFGRSAAARLAALDDARARWAERMEAFRRERANLGPAAVSRLLESSFTPEERVRVEALERMAGRPLP
jgi:lipase chaperone LimK